MEELSKIKEGLEAKLKELTNRVNSIESDLREPHDDNWTEDASESQNDEALEEIEKVASEEIAEVKVALSKIENGTYGKCEGCGGKISIKRLEALPYASKCLSCTA